MKSRETSAKWGVMKKGAINFVVANVCGLFPLFWIVLGWMPDQVKVQWTGNADANLAPAIVAGEEVLTGEPVGTWNGRTLWRFYLREDLRWKDLAFRLPPGKGPEDVGRIDLQKWKVLCFGKNGKELVPTGTGGDTWHFGNPRFDHAGVASRKVMVAFFAVELLLMGLSWLSAKRRREERWGALWRSIVLVAFSLTALTEVAVPIQSYLANQSTYPFSFAALAGALAFRVAWRFALGIVGIGLLTRCFGRWVLGAVLAFAVCVYLESGILSAGLPSLNGDWFYFHNHARALWDAAAWGAVFVLMAALHPVLKNHYGLAALCLLGMTVASMLDVRHEEKVDSGKLIVHDFAPIETVVRSVTYSTNRNVLVFVVDSLDREQAHDIMEDSEAGLGLREKFYGFTEFTDNVGAWSTSLPAVANMMTGRNPENAAGLADYFASPFSADSVLADYLDAGFSVFMDTEALGYGYANPRQNDVPSETKGGVFSRRLAGELGWTLGEVSRFRCWPFVAKATVAQLIDLGMPEREDWADEQIVYPVLSQGNVDGMRPGSFIFCHTRGVHGPVIRNHHGDRLPRPDNSKHGRKEAGIWVLEQLGKLFDAMREKGIYDNSLIMVLADHGPHESESDQNADLPSNGRPFLWVKPSGSDHEFTSEGAPTHHARIANVLQEACCRDLTGNEIQSILSSDNRIYRLMSGYGGEIRVWTVDGNGNCLQRKESMRSGELEPLQPGRRYHLGREQITQNGASIEFVNCGFWPSPVWLPDQPEMELRFRVPNPEKTYDVRLELKMTNQQQENESGATVRFSQQGNADYSRSVMADYRTTVLLEGVRPDENGLVTIAGQRGKGMASHVYFLELTVLETR